MRSLLLSLPDFGFIVATRAALAFGVGLLVAERIPEPRRRAAGLALVTIGAITTIPAVMAVAGSLSGPDRAAARAIPPTERDARLVGAARFPRKGDDDDFHR